MSRTYLPDKVICPNLIIFLKKIPIFYNNRKQKQYGYTSFNYFLSTNEKYPLPYSLSLLFIHAGALHALASSFIGLELKLWAQEIYGIWNIRTIQNMYSLPCLLAMLYKPINKF